MTIITKLVTKGIIIALILTMSNAYATSVTSKLPIRANVPLVLEHSIIKEPSLLIITLKDKKKGYININPETVLYVKTNNPNGYIISVACHISELFISLEIREGGRTFTLSPGGQVNIIEPYTKMDFDKKKLDFKFYLAPDVQIGSYQWPIEITISPM